MNTNQRWLLAISATLLAALALGSLLPTSGDDALQEPLLVDHDQQALDPSPGADASTARARADLAGGFYHLAVGTELRFRLALTQGMTLAVADRAQAEHTACEMFGEFVIAVLERTGNELVIEVTMPGLAAKPIAGSVSDNGSLLADLAKPALVRMRDDGAILGIDFPPDVHHQLPNWLRSVLAAARFVVHKDAGSWSCTEEDATGRADTVYDWQRPLEGAQGIVGKHKLRYLPSKGDGDADPLAHLQPEGEGKGVAVLDAELGWYTRVDYAEQFQLGLPAAGFTVAVDFSLALALDERGTRSRLAAVGSRSWQGMDGREAARTSGALEQAEKERKDAEQLAAPDLLLELDQTALREGADPFARLRTMASLTLLLRQQPAAIAELHDLLAAGGWKQATIDLALVAVAEAGTGPAQQLIADLLANGAAGPLGRSALGAVIALAAPNETVLARVAAIASGSDPGLTTPGLLALGCVAGRQPEASRAAAVESLRAARPGTAHGIDAWLHALGNSGLPECIELSEPYRRSGDASVRAAAFVALRRVPGAPSLALLREAAVGDPEPGVRQSAIDALDDRTAADTVPILAEVLDRETDQRTLRSALSRLGAAMPHPMAHELLNRTASSHPIPDVRQWAAAVLPPR